MRVLNKSDLRIYKHEVSILYIYVLAEGPSARCGKKFEKILLKKNTEKKFKRKYFRIFLAYNTPGITPQATHECPHKLSAH